MAVETVRKSDFCTNCLTLALPPYPPPPKKKTEITHYISPFAVVLQTTVVSAFLKIGARACMFVRVRACVRACVRVCVWIVNSSALVWLFPFFFLLYSGCTLFQSSSSWCCPHSNLSNREVVVKEPRTRTTTTTTTTTTNKQTKKQVNKQRASAAGIIRHWHYKGKWTKQEAEGRAKREGFMLNYVDSTREMRTRWSAPPGVS